MALARFADGRSEWLFTLDPRLFLRDPQAPSQLEQRIANATGFNMASAEDFQVVAYRQAAEYFPHVDFATMSGTERGGNRMATVMVYLRAPTAGGATVFTEVPVFGVTRELEASNLAGVHS